MFNLEKSWKNLFSEKQWGLKLLIPFLVVFLGICLLIPLFIVAFIIDSNSRYGSNSAYYLFLCFSCFAIIWALIVSYLSNWYTYESTQAAIENRQTKLIWEYSFVDGIKKVLKSSFVVFLYNLVLFVPLGLVLCCLSVFIPSFFSVFSNDRSSFNEVFFSSGIILFYCFIIIFSIIYYFYYYLLILPAQLRLYYTNTFAEAFKVREILDHSKKYWTKYMTLLGIAFLHGFLAGLVTVVLSCVAIIPCLGVIIYFIGYIVISFLNYYFQLFVFPHISGMMFRQLLIEEGKIREENGSNFTNGETPIIIA